MSLSVNHPVWSLPRRILIRMLIALSWLAMKGLHGAIGLVGVGRTYRFLHASSPEPTGNSPPTRTALAQIARVVQRASGSTEDYCLRRSLLIWWLLRWRGAPADIHCDTGLDKGHAWVESQGLVIGDQPHLFGTGRFGKFSTLFARPTLPTSRVKP